MPLQENSLDRTETPLDALPLYVGAGCVLPLEIRPLICRIYPFDYDHNGLLPELAKGCPVELLRQGQDLIAALEMDSADAKRWHRQLYAELLEEKVGQCGPTVPVGHEATINVDP